jgi:hypothetical protein
MRRSWASATASRSASSVRRSCRYSVGPRVEFARKVPPLPITPLYAGKPSKEEKGYETRGRVQEIDIKTRTAASEFR